MLYAILPCPLLSRPALSSPACPPCPCRVPPCPALSSSSPDVQERRSASTNNRRLATQLLPMLAHIQPLPRNGNTNNTNTGKKAEGTRTRTPTPSVSARSSNPCSLPSCVLKPNLHPVAHHTMSLACLPASLPPSLQPYARTPGLSTPLNPARRHKSAIGGAFRSLVVRG